MSELAAEASHSPAAFAAYRDPAAQRVHAGSARPTAVMLSLAVHLAALLVGAATWRPRERLVEPPLPVQVTLRTRPKLPAAAPRPPAAPAARPAPPQRVAPAPPIAEPLPQPEPAPVVANAEPTAADAGAAALAAESVGSSGQGSSPGGEGTGSGEGLPGAPPPPPPVISPARRQVVLASYLQEIFRSRIAAHFQYPEEAERLGMEGLVVVRASVLQTGALSSARTLGDCPQRILCAAAERTVRAAAPFPPPPAELGGAISIDVPLNYRLE